MRGIAVLPVFILFLILILALPILIGVYVYKDAARRSMNAALWTLLAIFAPGFVGLIIYLIVRSNYTDACCHKCGKPVRESFVVCPHCGASLKEHCYNCNGTLEGGWSNCPHCGTLIPEDQKSRMNVAPKKDKGLGRLLLVLIIAPVALCILLVFLVALFGVTKTQTSGYSFTNTVVASLESLAEDEPYLTDWVASCDAEGIGFYVLDVTDRSLPSDTSRFYIYRNDGYYITDIAIEESGFFSTKNEAHLTYLMPYEYNEKELLEYGMEEMPSYTLTFFEFSGENFGGVRLFDANGNEINYK